MRSKFAVQESTLGNHRQNRKEEVRRKQLFGFFLHKNTTRQTGSITSRVPPETEKHLCQCLVRKPRELPLHRQFQTERSQETGVQSKQGADFQRVDLEIELI